MTDPCVKHLAPRFEHELNFTGPSKKRQASPSLRDTDGFRVRDLPNALGVPDRLGFDGITTSERENYSPIRVLFPWDSRIAMTEVPSPESGLTNPPGNVSFHFFAYRPDLDFEDRALDETLTVSKLDDHLMDIDVVNEEGTVKPSEADAKMGYRSKQSLTLSYARGPSFVLQQNLNIVMEMLEDLSLEVEIMMGFDVLPAHTHLKNDDEFDFFTGNS